MYRRILKQLKDLPRQLVASWNQSVANTQPPPRTPRPVLSQEQMEAQARANRTYLDDWAEQALIFMRVW